jgi:hypothetical protein
MQKNGKENKRSNLKLMKVIFLDLIIKLFS